MDHEPKPPKFTKYGQLGYGTKALIKYGQTVKKAGLAMESTAHSIDLISPENVKKMAHHLAYGGSPALQPVNKIKAKKERTKGKVPPKGDNFNPITIKVQGDHPSLIGMDFAKLEKSVMAQMMSGNLTVGGLKAAMGGPVKHGKKLGPVTQKEGVIQNITATQMMQDAETKKLPLKVTPEGNVGDGVNLDVEYDTYHQCYCIRLFIWDYCWKTQITKQEMFESKAQSTLIEYALSELWTGVIEDLNGVFSKKLEHMVKLVKNSMVKTGPS